MYKMINVIGNLYKISSNVWVHTCGWTIYATLFFMIPISPFYDINSIQALGNFRHKSVP